MLESKITLPILLIETELASSRAEAKRLIRQGAVKVNNQIIKDVQKEIELQDGMIIQKGRRGFAKIEIETG